LYILIQISHLSNFLKMSKNWKTWCACHCLCQRNLSKICMLLFNLKIHLSKPIFISHHVMCSLISFCCCNHLNNMLMNVKLIVIQLELNDIGYKLVFHSYSTFASNTWYISYILIHYVCQCVCLSVKPDLPNNMTVITTTF